MGWVMPAVMGGSAILSALAGFFGNKDKKQEQEGTQNVQGQQFGNFNTFGTSRPSLRPWGSVLEENLANQYLQRMQDSPQALANAYTTTNLQNLNRGSDIARRVAMSTMAARGLGTSPIMGKVSSDLDTQRIMKGVDTINQGQLFIDQMIQQRMADAAKFFQTIPYGQDTTGGGTTWGGTDTTTNQQGTVTAQGQPWAGAGSSLATLLAGLIGAGAFKPRSGGGGNANIPGYGVYSGG